MKKLILLIAILISGFAFGQKAINLDGQIRVFNQLPKVWENTINFRASTESDLYTLGFRDVVQPILTQYQRRDTIYFDVGNDYFTYAVKDFTQAEIDAYDQEQLDSDASALKIESYKFDGQTAHKRIWDRIMREYDEGNITNAQFEGISNILFDAVLPLEFGLWPVAKSKVDVITPPGNAKMLAILDKVKEIINNYITENY